MNRNAKTVHPWPVIKRIRIGIREVSHAIEIPITNITVRKPEIIWINIILIYRVKVARAWIEVAAGTKTEAVHFSNGCFILRVVCDRAPRSNTSFQGLSLSKNHSWRTIESQVVRSRQVFQAFFLINIQKPNRRMSEA